MSTFEDRRKSLFDHLNKAEEAHNLSKAKESFPIGESEIDKRTYRRLKGEMRQFRGQESIFKRPEAPLSRCMRSRNLPRHIKEPNKWLHYSLEDVSESDLSDATNTATAYALLRQMEQRNKDQTLMICDTTECDKKPVFCFSATVKKEEEDPPEKITFKRNKVVMPEYVVGKVEKKIKKKVIKKEDTRQVQLKLEHLYDEED